MELQFDKVLGSKIDGRGGQLFFASYKSGNIFFSSCHLFSFYVRADDGLRDCWAELDLTPDNYKKLFKEIITNATLPIFDVSFEYLKKRVLEGIEYKKRRGLALPSEYDHCAPLLECKAIDDLTWENPSFFSKRIEDYTSGLSKKDIVNNIDGIIMTELLPEMFELGWGFNSEDMDTEWTDISKIKFHPYDIFIKMKISDRVSMDAKTRRRGDIFDALMRKLVKKIITLEKVREWEIRTREASYFCFNIGEKAIAARLYFISCSFQLVPSKISIIGHPFLQMLMLISILSTMKRNGRFCECGCENII